MKTWVIGEKLIWKVRIADFFLPVMNLYLRENSWKASILDAKDVVLSVKKEAFSCC
jgi:hypothetical protein